MEQRPQESEPQEKKESFLSKPTMIIVGAFLLLNIAVVGFILVPKFFSSKGPDKTGAPSSPLDKITLIELGRLEITKPIDPLQQNFMRCSVTVTLVVAADRAAEIEPRIRKFDALFKEQARKAFQDADPRDLSTENLAAVKNAIKTRMNETLGEEDVQEVVFGDFRPY